jgi:hypothetical protein
VIEWHLLSDSPKSLGPGQAIAAAGAGQLSGPVGGDDHDMIHALVCTGFK